MFEGQGKEEEDELNYDKDDKDDQEDTQGLPTQDEDSEEDDSAQEEPQNEKKKKDDGKPHHFLISSSSHSLWDEKRLNFTCYICGKVLNRRSHLSIHILTSHGLQLQNEEDGRRGGGRGDAEDEDYDPHRRPEKKGNHKCRFCGKVFNKGRLLKAHIYESHPKTSFIKRGQTCPICAQKFPDVKSLQIHLMNHQGRCHQGGDETLIKRSRNGYRCRFCTRAYACTEDVVSHELKTHPDLTPFTSRDKIKCQFCAKDFTRKHSLMRHIKDQLCSVLYPSTSSSSSSSSSSLSSTKDSSSSCSSSSASSNSGNSLLHELSDNDASFGKKATKSCHFCGRRFVRQEDVVFHELRHHPEVTSYTSEDACKCKYCGTVFSRARTLHDHIKTRRCAELDPEKCRFCGLHLGTRVKRHMEHELERHADETIYTSKDFDTCCNACGQVFDRQYLFERHNCSQRNNDNLRKSRKKRANVLSEKDLEDSIVEEDNTLQVQNTEETIPEPRFVDSNLEMITEEEHEWLQNNPVDDSPYGIFDANNVKIVSFNMAPLEPLTSVENFSVPESQILIYQMPETVTATPTIQTDTSETTVVTLETTEDVLNSVSIVEETTSSSSSSSTESNLPENTDDTNFKESDDINNSNLTEPITNSTHIASDHDKTLAHSIKYKNVHEGGEEEESNTNTANQASNLYEKRNEPKEINNGSNSNSDIPNSSQISKLKSSDTKCSSKNASRSNGDKIDFENHSDDAKDSENVKPSSRSSKKNNRKRLNENRNVSSEGKKKRKIIDKKSVNFVKELKKKSSDDDNSEEVKEEEITSSTKSNIDYIDSDNLNIECTVYDNNDNGEEKRNNKYVPILTFSDEEEDSSDDEFMRNLMDSYGDLDDYTREFLPYVQLTRLPPLFRGKSSAASNNNDDHEYKCKICKSHFRCFLCSNSHYYFSNESKLENHISNRHKMNLICHICCKSFPKSLHLYQHLDEHHSFFKCACTSETT